LTEPEIVTEALGGSPLSLAAQRGHVPEAWYAPRPATVAQWRARAVEVAQRFNPEWLARLEPAIRPSGSAGERLRRVAAARGIVVTSGQQPGLFGGPAYTFSKALSARALADQLERQTGIPVAPVFWAATDDADFGEASQTTIAIDGELVRLALQSAPPPGTPMDAVPLGDVGTELAHLERACGSAAFGTALDAVRGAYRVEATIGEAFVALLRALLEPLGIAILDASHPLVRAEGAPVLRKAAARASVIADALRSRASELRAAGFTPQVVDVEELSVVFSLRDGRRRRLRIDEASALAAAGDPEPLSPNVLLRPIVERAILPTVAYAAGPAELAYFAQVSAVADALDTERPLAVPRWSGTIIEPHVGRILRRLGARHTDLRDAHALEGKVARAHLPATVPSALARVRDAIDRAAAALERDADAAALVPAAVVSGAKGSLLARLGRLERRYAAAAKRRHDELFRDIATARAQLYPNGKRQERVLNFIPMLARHGWPLLDAMREEADAHAATLVSGSGEAVATPPDRLPAHGRTRA
jgi:bacillithiol biosynthesis cysteine-adding enzyme BshC